MHKEEKITQHSLYLLELINRKDVIFIRAKGLIEGSKRNSSSSITNDEIQSLTADLTSIKIWITVRKFQMQRGLSSDEYWSSFSSVYLPKILELLRDLASDFCGLKKIPEIVLDFLKEAASISNLVLEVRSEQISTTVNDVLTLRCTLNIACKIAKMCIKNGWTLCEALRDRLLFGSWRILRQLQKL